MYLESLVSKQASGAGLLWTQAVRRLGGRQRATHPTGGVGGEPGRASSGEKAAWRWVAWLQNSLCWNLTMVSSPKPLYTVSQQWLQPKLDGKRNFIAESFLRRPYINIWLTATNIHRALFEKICSLEAENSLFQVCSICSKCWPLKHVGCPMSALCVW